MKRTWRIVLLLIMCLSVSAYAQNIQGHKPAWTHPGPLRPDSGNFVTASLLVTSPGNNFYSNLGHCTLRMECPSFNLDYCFSFETDVAPGDFVRFFAGQANGHIVAVPTAQYLKPYQSEGRSVRQYVLNLTPHEKQELWRLLDQDMVNVQNRKFNFLQNNCSSISLLMIEDAMLEEQIEYIWHPRVSPSMPTGKVIRHTMRHSPWMSFIAISLAGSEADAIWDNHLRVSPEILAPILKRSHIVDIAGNSRPVLTGEVKPLLPLKEPFRPSPITPALVFSILLAIVLLVTLLERKTRWKMPARIIDAGLFTLQTTVGVLLIYVSTVSCLFGTHWNWYLIPFNPVPFIVWLLFRKRKNYYKTYLFYGVVLMLFMLATPLSQQLDVEHQLITATLTVRCFAVYLSCRGNERMSKHGRTKKKP